jgi:hypothetical protein
MEQEGKTFVHGFVLAKFFKNLSGAPFRPI